MFLYHYAAKRFTVLKTLEHQRRLTKEEKISGKELALFMGDPGPYYSHISFFVDQLNLEELATLYKGKAHPLWSGGVPVFEHRVDARAFRTFDFMWVETPFDRAFAASNWKPQMSISAKERYFKKLNIEKRRRCLIGSGLVNLIRGSRAFIGGTMPAYREAVKTFDDVNWSQYAPNVPHVMIYPREGVVGTHGLAKRLIVDLSTDESR